MTYTKSNIQSRCATKLFAATSFAATFALILGTTGLAQARDTQVEDEHEGGSADDEVELESTTFGVGFQSSWPTFGVSGTMDLTEELAVQGVLGLFGTINMFGGRGLYRFKAEELWNLYGYGSVGAVTHRFLGERETTLGLGAGAGIEYDWRAWQRKLPPIRWNLEIGLAYADFDYFDYTGFTFGGGVHYRF